MSAVMIYDSPSGPYTKWSEIRDANQRAGYYFFSPDTMRFWRSRLCGEPIVSASRRAIYFVTSEKPWIGRREYSVRRMDAATADVDTVVRYGFATRRAALAAAERLAASS